MRRAAASAHEETCAGARVPWPAPGRAWRPWHDASRRRPSWWLAIVVGLPQLLGTVAAGDHFPERHSLDAPAIALLGGSAAALVARRRAPVATLGAVTALTATYYGLGYPYGPAFLAEVVATVGAVTHGHRRASWAILLAGLTWLVTLDRLVGARHPLTVAQIIVHACAVLAILGLGELARGRAERFAEMRRGMQEARRREASEERLRLARELHDVLAHNVSLINVQASTALHLFDADPERARGALRAIKDASRQSLVELRGTVDALRSEGEAAPRTPTPGLDQLNALVAQTRDLGIAVDVIREGEPRHVAASLDLAAYRIIQEALTNVRRHSSARGARVILRYEPEELTVGVTDDGRTMADVGRVEGHGLRGMRERALALGGSFDVTTTPTGGFVVTARLPLRPPVTLEGENA